MTITPNKLTNQLTTQFIMDSKIIVIEGLNFRPNSPKNSVEKFSLFSHLLMKYGNNNKMGCLFLLCHDLGLKIFKAIQTIKSEIKDIIS